MTKLSLLVIDICWGARAGCQPTDGSNSFFLYLRQQNLSPRKASFWRARPGALLPGRPHAFVHAVISPCGGFPVSLNFDSSQVISEIIWIRERIHFHCGHRTQLACLLNTKQTPSLPNTPLSVITKKMQHRAQSIISNFSWRKLI